MEGAHGKGEKKICPLGSIADGLSKDYPGPTSPWVGGVQELPDGYVLANPDSGVDRRTAAEKRHDELMAKKEAERVKKWAAKSHRERINEFNNYLQDLSEHHDIPKVGPG